MISIHALRMERDTVPPLGRVVYQHFNPRAPHGARPMDEIDEIISSGISIHALRMERD